VSLDERAESLKRVAQMLQYNPLTCLIDPNSVDLDNEEEITELDLKLDDIFKSFPWLEPAKCECGATKTYGENALHSRWCPKFEEVFKK
jgi:hypothetical protein